MVTVPFFTKQVPTSVRRSSNNDHSGGHLSFWYILQTKEQGHKQFRDPIHLPAKRQTKQKSLVFGGRVSKCRSAVPRGK